MSSFGASSYKTTDTEAFLFDKILQQQGGFLGLFKDDSNDNNTSAVSSSSVNSGIMSETSISDVKLESQEGAGSVGKQFSPSSDEGSQSGQNDVNGAFSKRKYHNKSRNGCATCKKRRVKCDEGHPVCKKCEHMKIECVYLPVEPKIRRKKKEIMEERARKAAQFQSQLEEHPSNGQNAQPAIPSIKIDHYGVSPSNYTTSPTLTNTSMHAISGSMGSIISASSPPSLSQHGMSPDLAHSVQSNGSPSMSSPSHDKAAIMLQAAAAHLRHQHHPSAAAAGAGVSSGNTTAAAAAAAAAALASSIPQANPTTTPQQIQQKIQQAQEYQKERVKKFQEYANKSEPNLSPSVTSPTIGATPLNNFNYSGNLNMLDLRLMYHYTTKVWPTITGAGISEERIWSEDIPMLAFDYPFLMHSILAFSATHLSRTERGLDQCVTCHRGDALRLLREAVLEISPQNTDALVASALILIMDSLANASLPTSTSPKSLPASAWIFHVKGAATILTAVWPLNESSRFYKFIGVDLGDLGDIINTKAATANGTTLDPSNASEAMIAAAIAAATASSASSGSGGSGAGSNSSKYSSLQCFDDEIADLYPVPYDSPYLITLAYLNKLHNERYKSDFILRIFAFPALLDKVFLGLLITGDIAAMRIMRSYYSLLRSFTTEMKDKVWFLEGVSKVLPVDVEQYSGGGGMHMMLDFLGGPSTLDLGGDEDAESYAEIRNGLLNPDNLPSTATNNMDIMQGDNEFM